MLEKQQELKEAIKNAENLHGHLGPFLIIGVRMGRTAQRISSAEENSKLQAFMKTPLHTPFSCVIDGVQSSTRCTIGNQRLRVENSKEEIRIRFELQDQNKTLDVSVNPEVIKGLMDKLSKGASAEELAWEIAHIPENQLFTIEKQ